MSNKKHWLDDMPNKELVWHGLYDVMRGFTDDVEIGMEIEKKVWERLDAIEKLKDEPEDVVVKLKETQKWLGEFLQ